MVGSVGLTYMPLVVLIVGFIVVTVPAESNNGRVHSFDRLCEVR